MSPDSLAALVVFLGLGAYIVFGGTDFGNGVLTALATGPRGSRQRDAVFRTMGPIWEANHVWLILVIVTLFTTFPTLFSHLSIALLVPILIALIGIIFRGSAFAFRHFGHGTGAELPAMDIVFSASSIITPAAMGMALGAVVSGHIAIEAGEVTSGLFESWLRPFPIVCGLLAVASCAFLSACYMTFRTSGDLREDFRTRGIGAGLLLLGLMAVAIPAAYSDAEPFWEELLAPAPLAIAGVAALTVLGSVIVLWRRLFALVVPAAAGAVALSIAAWAAAQYPYAILPAQRIYDLSADRDVIVLFLITLVAAVVVLVPSLALLYFTFREKTG